MTVLGVILLVLGAISAVYGYQQNNNVGSQLESLFSSGTANPGTVWIVVGVIALVVGLVLLIAGITKKNR